MKAAIPTWLLLAMFSPAAAAAEGMTVIEQGRSIVTLYCADCHATAAQGDSPHSEAPPFRDLHLRYDVEWLGEGLVEGLVSGHPDMPEFEFDPVQAEAIILYLKSLE